jgi:diguanylate cyclase (GGDEF)-like protein
VLVHHGNAWRGMMRLTVAAVALWCGQTLSEVVVVGGEDGYKPYETLDESGQPVGFHIDLMTAIAREMGFEVRFQLGPWEEARQALQSGDIDVLGMIVSPERAETVDFARSHVIVHHRIFIPAEAPPVYSIEDLTGKRVIVQRAAFSHEHLLDIDLDAELTLVDTDSEGLHLLAEGQHDAALLTEHRGRFTLRGSSLDVLTVSGAPVLPVEYAFAVRKGNDAVLAAINEGLERVRASGEFDRIYERWLQPYDSRPLPAFPTTLGIAVAALILLLVAVAGWQMFRLLGLRADKLKAEAQLEFLKTRDALTGLTNRLAFEDQLSRFLDQIDGMHEHVLLGVNIDQFRLINENLGHAGGDRLLTAVAERLTSAFGKDARIARLGSDEFAVLMPYTSKEPALEKSKGLLESINGLEPRPGMKVSVSIGLVPFDGKNNNAAQLLRRADCAGLAAKEDGGNRVHSWHDQDRRLAERVGMLRWVGQIQAAIHEDRMEIYYQPIANARTSGTEFHAVEMLVRMRTANGEILPAGMFMPAAERYFLSPEIDRWMVVNVLEWLDEQPNVLDCLERVNINLSGRSLGDDQFLEFLTDHLRQNSHLIDKLCFEITETALIGNLGKAQSVLADLHEQGCKFALDDFGSGLSSMAYLKNLPVDYLKIDGGFVRDIDHDNAALEMVREINRLGQAIGKITIAEYVESELIRELLIESNIDLLQGFAIGHPAPLEDLLGWCRNRTTSAHGSA